MKRGKWRKIGRALSAQVTASEPQQWWRDTREGDEQPLGADRGERLRDGSLNITWAECSFAKNFGLSVPSTRLGGGFQPAESSVCRRGSHTWAEVMRSRVKALAHGGLRELRGREASLPAEEVRGCFFRGWGRNAGTGPYGESRQRQVT